MIDKIIHTHLSAFALGHRTGDNKKDKKVGESGFSFQSYFHSAVRHAGKRAAAKARDARRQNQRVRDGNDASCNTREKKKKSAGIIHACHVI